MTLRRFFREIRLSFEDLFRPTYDDEWSAEPSHRFESDITNLEPPFRRPQWTEYDLHISRKSHTVPHGQPLPRSTPQGAEDQVLSMSVADFAASCPSSIQESIHLVTSPAALLSHRPSFPPSYASIRDTREQHPSRRAVPLVKASLESTPGRSSRLCGPPQMAPPPDFSRIRVPMTSFPPPPRPPASPRPIRSERSSLPGLALIQAHGDANQPSLNPSLPVMPMEHDARPLDELTLCGLLRRCMESLNFHISVCNISSQTNTSKQS